MKLIDLTCPKCSAVLNVNSELKTISCNYCGHTFLMSNTDVQAGYDFERGRMMYHEEVMKKKEEALRLEEEKRIAEKKHREETQRHYAIQRLLAMREK